MDSSLYKDFKTSRGVTYHYFSSPPHGGKPILLFLHGFPSTSYDWRHQLAYFHDRGYGLVVPDMLGYGGTDKPENVADYRSSLICRDIVDLLDYEGLEKVVVIGHDWGSKITSRLANYYPERFTAYAFLALGYLPPGHNTDLAADLQKTKQALGYELYGYWLFFSEDGADRIIDDHWDSMFSLVFPYDSNIWKTDVAGVGALKSSLLANKIGPLPSYITEEEKEVASRALRPLKAPLNWYKVMTSGISAEDDKSIPKDRASFPDAPILFVAANKDYICLAEPQRQKLRDLGGGRVRIESLNADHWVMLSHASEVNKLLEGWIEGGFT
ncbi:alpha/beta-hydrolase [Heliocybe sulcata]|uniref:Alpha/beta-hydrolase n=1 Tax=Heliocybe sulcata TaxID=5364 RepID=A0A5C3MZ94_9AGAM|nr:alpha/beta-hydrolase [Heliocybe sulcata]